MYNASSGSNRGSSDRQSLQQYRNTGLGRRRSSLATTSRRPWRRSHAAPYFRRGRGFHSGLICEETLDEEEETIADDSPLSGEDADYCYYVDELDQEIQSSLSSSSQECLYNLSEMYDGQAYPSGENEEDLCSETGLDCSSPRTPPGRDSPHSHGPRLRRQNAFLGSEGLGSSGFSGVTTRGLSSDEKPTGQLGVLNEGRQESCSQRHRHIQSPFKKQGHWRVQARSGSTDEDQRLEISYGNSSVDILPLSAAISRILIDPENVRDVWQAYQDALKIGINSERLRIPLLYSFVKLAEQECDLCYTGFKATKD